MINKWFVRCSKTTICLCVLVSLTVWLAGCSTLAETPDEVGIRHTLINKTNMQQMQDDFDSIFMLEQPTRLTEMYVR